MAEFSGIDVSKYQGEIRWQEVRESGVQFAMIRASYGISGVDPCFSENAVRANAAGIDCGAYHYSYAKTVLEARQEAAHFLEVVKGKEMRYPLALDLEDSSLAALSPEDLTDIAIAFLEEVEGAGYYVMLYANLSWLLHKLELGRLSRFDIWLAQWADSYTFRGDVGMWQFTDRGEVSGIDGHVDKNKAFSDFARIIREGGLNHLEEKAAQWKIDNVRLAVERGILKSEHDPLEIVDMGTAATIANNLYDLLKPGES